MSATNASSGQQYFRDQETGHYYYWSAPHSCYCWYPSGQRREFPNQSGGAAQQAAAADRAPYGQPSNPALPRTLSANQQYQLSSASGPNPSAAYPAYTTTIQNPANRPRGASSSSGGSASSQLPSAGGIDQLVAPLNATSLGGGSSSQRKPLPHKSIQGSGAEGDYEPLDPRYKIRNRQFFKNGRVFKVFWSENTNYDSGATNVTPSREVVRDPKHGQYIYSKIRWFVVIREGERHCSCHPIVTYGSQGVGKPGVVKNEHAIVHTTREPQAPRSSERAQRGERPMRESIRVVPDEPSEKLDDMSRVDFGRTYTVEHNIKAMAFGWVHKNSERALHYNSREVYLSGVVSTESIPQATPATQVPQNSTAAASRDESTEGETRITLADLIKNSRGYKELLAEHGQHAAVARDPRYSLLVARARKRLEEDSE